MEDIVGAGTVIVNVTEPLVPADVLTVMLRLPAVAVESMINVAFNDVPLVTVTEVTVIPVPPLMLTVVPPEIKFVRVKVTGTLDPRNPDDGLIEESVGLGAATVNPPVSLAVPPDVVTRTSRAPVAAVLLIVMLSEMLVASTETTEPVTPVPLKVTAVAPTRFVPVIVAPRIVAP